MLWLRSFVTITDQWLVESLEVETANTQGQLSDLGIGKYSYLGGS